MSDNDNRPLKLLIGPELHLTVTMRVTALLCGAA
jgi:hypothetical protein